MRFEELILRIPGDEFRIRFHEHLTVLSGIGMLERQALADSLVGTLVGTADSTVLTYTDFQGRRIQLASAGGGRTVAAHLDDRSPSPPLTEALAVDPSTLRSLMLVHAADLGLVPTGARPDDPPELAEARTTLAALTEELESVMAGRQEVERLRAELAAIDVQLRAAEDGETRREYARVLADLERVRAEAAARRNGSGGADSDRLLLATADENKRLETAWTQADGRLRELRRRLGDRERMDRTTLARASSFPAQIPAVFDELVDRWAAAAEERDDLESRLRALAAARLPDPSDPRVVDLATVDQASLWGTRQRVAEAAARLGIEQLRLGGLDPASSASIAAGPGPGTPTAGVAPGVAVTTEALERAHARVIGAEEAISRRKLPTLVTAGVATVLSLLAGSTAPLAGLVLLGSALAVVGAGIGLPRRRLRAARRSEQSALQQTGAVSYLAFHLRRIDAVVDPGARRRLDAAALEHRRALEAWHDVAPGVSVEDAGALEAEVRSYAAALAGMGSAADEIHSLHASLSQRAEPALAQARAALAEACAPFGVDDHEVGIALDAGPGGLRRLIAQQVHLGSMARLQGDLEEVETEHTALTARLETMLGERGFRDGDFEARLGALAWAVEQAREREEARARDRPMEEVEADLARLEDEAASLRRPEWAAVTAADAEAADLAALARRRDSLLSELRTMPAADVDVERLADRQSAMERRVAALEARFSNGHGESTMGQIADVQQFLLAHLARAAHVGPHDEPVPVVMDEPFLRIAAERKWELLDALRRMAEKTQLVYLTDDPFVTAWARRRAAAGLIVLLEPVAEPV